MKILETAIRVIVWLILLGIFVVGFVYFVGEKKKKAIWKQDDSSAKMVQNRFEIGDDTRTLELKVVDKSDRSFAIRKVIEDGDTTTTVEISDSMKVVGYFEKGNWQIHDCKKSVEVLIQCIMQMQENFNNERIEWMNTPVAIPIYSNLKTKQ